jgi:hypothetical protein
MKRILNCGIFIGIILTIIFSTAPTQAAGNEEKNIPVSYPGQSYKVDFIIFDHYPDRFDGIGRLDELREDAVIIEDSMINLAPNVKFRGPKKGSASKNLFKPGQRVGYIVGTNKEIVSLWLLVKASKED